MGMGAPLSIKTMLGTLYLFGVLNAQSNDWFKIRLRVHTAKSQLPEANLKAAFTEINKIWAQAQIVFDIENVKHEEIMPNGFDLWIEAETRSYNGVYQGQHQIWTTDKPSLGSAPNPVQYNVARTSAHELGHALGLSHYNDAALPDQRNNLLASGTKGWELKPSQISTARGVAAQARIGALRISNPTTVVSGPRASEPILASILSDGQITVLMLQSDRAAQVHLLDLRGRTTQSWGRLGPGSHRLTLAGGLRGDYFLRVSYPDGPKAQRIQIP